jgi:hypothetical protein
MLGGVAAVVGVYRLGQLAGLTQKYVAGMPMLLEDARRSGSHRELNVRPFRNGQVDAAVVHDRTEKFERRALVALTPTVGKAPNLGVPLFRLG